MQERLACVFGCVVTCECMSIGTYKHEYICMHIYIYTHTFSYMPCDVDMYTYVYSVYTYMRKCISIYHIDIDITYYVGVFTITYVVVCV